jgi:hypothetical protein
MERRRHTRQKYPLPEWLTAKVQTNLEKLLRQHPVEGKAKAHHLLSRAEVLPESDIRRILSQLRTNMDIDTLNDMEAKAKHEVLEAIRLQEREAQAEIDRAREETRNARLELGYREAEIAKMEEEDPSDDELENLFRSDK